MRATVSMVCSHYSAHPPKSSQPLFKSRIQPIPFPPANLSKPLLSPQIGVTRLFQKKWERWEAEPSFLSILTVQSGKGVCLLFVGMTPGGRDTNHEQRIHRG